jgi:hypothetical protein
MLPLPTSSLGSSTTDGMCILQVRAPPRITRSITSLAKRPTAWTRMEASACLGRRGSKVRHPTSNEEAMSLVWRSLGGLHGLILGRRRQDRRDSRDADGCHADADTVRVILLFSFALPIRLLVLYQSTHIHRPLRPEGHARGR